ncbi:MAG: phenylalanine--tRNA ligase beta subunit-related protein [Candidatus Stygibacter frigidus]|nr:phenylalanine--tRNA ligase beta subunit-related protein [Candidatus Stygibacter frigidus]
MKEERNEKGMVKLAIARLQSLANKAVEEPYAKLIELGTEYCKRYSKLAIGEISGVDQARDLFKEIGIDPTKRRPSSEALLRRGLKNKGYNSINPLVDIGNWCSLEFLLPICVYDASSVEGKLTGRMGRSGDGYIAIDNQYLDLNERYLIADEKGALGSPIKDSLRTRVTLATTDAMLLIYAPGYISDRELIAKLDVFIKRVQKYCGGIEKEKYLQTKEIKE